MRKSMVCGALVIWGAAAATSQAAVMVNFESVADLTSNFNTTGTTYTLTTSAPTLGTGSLQPSGGATDSVATYKTSTFGLAVGQQITLSMDVAKFAPTSTGAPLLQLGFSSAASDSFSNSSSTISTIYSRIIPRVTGSSATFDAVYDYKSTGTTTASEKNGQVGFSISNVSPQGFFEYSTTLQRTEATTFVESGFLQRVDTDGTTLLGSPIATFTSTPITNAGLAALADAGTMYAGFRSAGSNFGTLRLDDFSVSDASAVPEPASLAVVALGGAGLLARKRKTFTSSAD